MQHPGRGVALLAFEDREYELEWQGYFHRSQLRLDLTCCLAALAWGSLVGQRWLYTAHGFGIAGALWCCSHLACCGAILALLRWRQGLYVRHRPAILALVRLVHVLGFVALYDEGEFVVWPLPSTCAAASLLAVQGHRLLHLLSGSVAYQLPLCWNFWLVGLSAASAISTLPGRCRTQCAAVAAGDDVALLGGLLGKLWIFSPAGHGIGGGGGSAGGVVEPWQACAILNASTQLVVGALLPLMLFANLEETSRQAYMAQRYGTRFYHPASTRVAFTLALAPLLAALVYQAVQLVVVLLL